jgi:hypothetical protein
MRTDVVTLFPAEFEIGDSVFDLSSHRWHEITGIDSGDGQLVMLATDDGLELHYEASERHHGRLAAERDAVLAEHLRLRTTVDQLTGEFWD